MPTPTDRRKGAREKLREQRRKLQEAERLLGGDPYEHHRDAAAKRATQLSVEGREIGPLPAVQDPDRRALCADDLELFEITYFPHRFYLAFCDAHREANRQLQGCTRDGGQFLCGMPRGFGKDTLTDCAALHALLYGKRRYLVLLLATDGFARKALKRIKTELETNELLLADFPEVCYPIRSLERINQRAAGQTLDGRPTRMEFTVDSLVLPHIAGSASSGSAVYAAGLTGAIRGLNILGPDGEPIRPDMVILNDVQTRESAKSPTQTADREAIVSDDVLRLAGPTTTIAAVMLGTVIYRNDLTDRFLDKDRHPEWRSLRTKLLLAFPERMDLWDDYAEVRRAGLRMGDDGEAGNQFYAARREEMDRGVRAAWPEWKKAGEMTAAQSAMNFYYDNPRGFWAEGQNEPQAAALAEGTKELRAEALVSRLSGLDRYMVPRECSRLTAFIDPGLTVLWYSLVAWTERGGGSVIDYGCWPRQSRTWFEARDARPSLKEWFPGHTDPQIVFAGLRELMPEVLRPYPTESGGQIIPDRVLVDCGWLPDAVFQFLRQHGGPIYPSKGIGRTLTSRGVSEWTRRPGEQTGYHWRLTVPESGRIRMVQFDPDAWKSRIHELLTTPLGGVRSLTLFGKSGSDEERRRSASRHEMIANHLAAEYSTPATIRGNTFDKWEIRPERPDNHLLDTVVGAAVAAGVAGVQWSATPTGEPAAKPKQGRTLAELQAAARKEKTRAR